jgi:hypothetical protein
LAKPYYIALVAAIVSGAHYAELGSCLTQIPSTKKWLLIMDTPIVKGKKVLEEHYVAQLFS